MNKFNLLVVVGCFFYSALALSAAKYVEGKDYQVISDRLSSSPEVTEIFSYYCPACYGFEPAVKQIKTMLPEGVKFNKSHVDFMRQASKSMQQALSRALVVAEQLKVDKSINQAIFNRIHRDRKKFKTEADIRQLFVDHGVDGSKFDKMMKSFRVKTQGRKMKKYQDDLSKAGHLQSIPALVVNGKYMLNREKLRTPEDYNEVITHLLSLK